MRHIIAIAAAALAFIPSAHAAPWPNSRGRQRCVYQIDRNQTDYGRLSKPSLAFATRAIIDPCTSGSIVTDTMIRNWRNMGPKHTSHRVAWPARIRKIACGAETHS